MPIKPTPLSKLPVIIIALVSTSLYSQTWATPVPADTYFSIAVSDNSHNHYGENLMFLDFEDHPSANSRHPRTVSAPRLAEQAITLDGKVDDWPEQQFTVIPGRVMNNYPLSDHYDATPTKIRLASGFDNQYIYFAVQWEDANHDASIDRNRWVYDGKEWAIQRHVIPSSGTVAANAVNRRDLLARDEDEDQLFMMFPIVDQQGNFLDQSLGCAGYCHPNLTLSVDPTKGRIGDGASSMHTAFPDDRADLWHWTASRSRPMNTLKDGYVDYGEESYNGRKVDDGSNPFQDNALNKPFRPRYVHKGDFAAGHYQSEGYRTAQLGEGDLEPIVEEMTFAKGVSIPYYIGVAASGSRADVDTAAYFNTKTHSWTVEMRRKRETKDENDHQFVAGNDAKAPSDTLVQPGDPLRGAQLFKDKTCASCHGERGEGNYADGRWKYPRNQRVSGPAIRKTVSLHRPKRLQNIAYELKRWDEHPPEALMPFIPLTSQEAEDIGSWLQQQITPWGE